MANPSVDIDFSNLHQHVNDIYIPALYIESRFLVLMGGGGSGKSKFAAQKVIIRTLQEKKSRIGVVRKVGNKLRNSVYNNLSSFIHQWKLDKYFEFNKTELRITCILNGNEILCLGLDEVERIKSIEGITSWWIEEATELREEDLDQLNIRLRGTQTNYKQIMLSFNPISAHHWLKKKFFDLTIVSNMGLDGRYKNRKVIIPIDDKKITLTVTTLTTTYKDNRYLDDEYKATLEAYKFTNPHLYNVYAKGLWGVREGLVYDYPHVIPSSQFPLDTSLDQIFYGLDFGFNAPSSLIKIGIKTIEGTRNVFVKELLYHKGLTTEELSRKMGSVIRPLPGKSNRSCQLCADSANPDRIKDLKRMGWNVIPSVKGANSIINGVDFIKGLYPNLHVSDDSINLLKEFAGYFWPMDSDGVQLDDNPQGEDHALDAMRYPLYTFVCKRTSQGVVRTCSNWRV